MCSSDLKFDTQESIKKAQGKVKEWGGYKASNEARAKQASKNVNAKAKALEERNAQAAALQLKNIEIEDYKASKTAGAKVLNTAPGNHGSRLSDFLKPKVVFNRLKEYTNNISAAFTSAMTSAMSIMEVKAVKNSEAILTRVVANVEASVKEYMNKDMAIIDVAYPKVGEGYQSISQLLLVDGKLSDEVTLAIAVASTEWMANVSSMRAGHRTEKVAKQLLKKSAGDSMTPAEWDAIADVDMFLTTAANSLGADISKIIGWSIDLENDPEADLKKRKLDNELGLIALHALARTTKDKDGKKVPGIITIKTKDSADIFVKNNTLVENGRSRQLNVIKFTAKGNAYLDNKSGIASRTARLISDIFNTEKKLKPPRGAKAKKKVFKNKSGIQNKHTTVNPTVQSGLNAAQNVKWNWNDDFIGDVFLMLEDEAGRERLEKLMGYVDPATKHVRYAKALTSENNRIKREITELEAARAEAMRKGNTSIFFDYFYGKNGRVYVETNTLNPQLSKLQLMALSSEEGVVTSDRDVDMYDKAMAGAFGVKTDKLTLQDDVNGTPGILTTWAKTEAKLQELEINTLGLEDAITAVEDYNSAIDSNKDMSKAEKKAAKIGGYGPLLFAGLVEYRKYANAKALNGSTKGVNPTIIMEVDGVTNGYVLKSLQMPLLDDMKTSLQSGGVMIGTRFDKKPKLSKYQVWEQDAEGTSGVMFEYGSTTQQIMDPSTLDAYEVPAKKMDVMFQAIFGKKNTQPESLKRFAELATSSSLFALNNDGSTEMPEITREFMKPPFMTFNYGAGMTGIIQDMADTTIDEVYSLLEQLHAAELANDKDASKALTTRLEALFRASNDTWVKGEKGWEATSTPIDSEQLIRELHTAISNGTLLQFNIPQPTIDAMGSSVKASVGEMVKEVFQDYKPFIDASTTINDSFKVMFRLFKARLDDAIEFREKELSRPLTENEVDAIISVLGDSMPAIQTALAEGAKDNLIIMDESASLVDAGEDGKITGQTKYRYNTATATARNKTKINALEQKLATAAKGPEYNKIAAEIKTLKNGYTSSQAKQYILIEAMAAGSVIPIHFIDGVLMASTLSQTNGMGNHDAVYESPLNVDQTSSHYDMKMAQISKEYSLTAEILKSLISAINSAEPGQVKKVNEQYLVEAYDVTNSTTVQSVISDMKDLYRNSERGRTEVLSNPIRYDHLANEGGHYDWNMSGEDYVTPPLGAKLSYKFSQADEIEMESSTFTDSAFVEMSYPKSNNPDRVNRKNTVSSVAKLGGKYIVHVDGWGNAAIVDGKTGLNKTGKVKFDIAELERLLKIAPVDPAIIPVKNKATLDGYSDAATSAAQSILDNACGSK